MTCNGQHGGLEFIIARSITVKCRSLCDTLPVQKQSNKDLLGVTQKFGKRIHLSNHLNQCKLFWQIFKTNAHFL